MILLFAALVLMAVAFSLMTNANPATIPWLNRIAGLTIVAGLVDLVALQGF
ncbi:hypothetical protein [Paraferrimonas sedimenticola]|uniref:Uncharacterized protein n=1 Tax=Paraferrimonas sedimenticola TaxID=375674 RepID=A0AA37RUN2_9GAMM|nr:hypothetical protein [Paraferrimonas sedimenticola]GLP95481.1 hypothetical protein GCM10007895_07870 [Paraferrimonas sedimenticola]